MLKLSQNIKRNQLWACVFNRGKGKARKGILGRQARRDQLGWFQQTLGLVLSSGGAGVTVRELWSTRASGGSGFV